MLLNIELKGPRYDEARASQYNFDLVSQKVIALIDEFDIADKVMISSNRLNAL